MRLLWEEVVWRQYTNTPSRILGVLMCPCFHMNTHTHTHTHTYKQAYITAYISAFFCFSARFTSSEEIPLFSPYCRASIYQCSPDSQLCVKWVSCVNFAREIHTQHCPVCVYVCGACLWHEGTSVAPDRQMLVLMPHDCSLLIAGVSGHILCCCSSYGLVSSSYWLLVKLEAGARLIKDTWVCVAY